MKSFNILLFVAWVGAGAINYGVAYAYFTNQYPSLDSSLERRQNSAFAMVLAIIGPIAVLPVMLMSGFYYYGLQYSGGPRENKNEP